VAERSPAGDAGIEVFVIGLDSARHARGLMDELSALHQRGVIRVVDALVVNREADDTISASARTQLSPDEAEQFRRLMRDAIGFQPDNGGFGAGLDWQGGSVLLGPTDARLIGQSLSPGQAALAVVFEHRWAYRLTRLVHEGGVTLLEDELLAPEFFASALGRTP
jgi:hypothetical protein